MTATRATRSSMVLRYEKTRADDKTRLLSFRNLYRVVRLPASSIEMIVRPGQSLPSTSSSYTGLLSLAAMGIAVATVIQIASNCSLC